MQPKDEKDYVKETKILLETVEWLFKLENNGERLKPVGCGSRACTNMYKYFHSFVGESAVSIWVIAQSWCYLLGIHLYWVWYCTGVKQIFEYNGNIAMFMHLAQKLLGCHFTLIHMK